MEYWMILRKMELFDSHAHYDDEKFAEDRDLVIKQIYETGVTKFMSSGYNIESSKNGLELARKYDYIYTTCGISPNDIWMYYDELCAIYKSQTVYDDPDQIEAAVDALCDDDRATLQTNVSRIKRKLVDKVGKIAADRYAIVRGKDNIYRIAVPRELVVIPV